MPKTLRNLKPINTTITRSIRFNGSMVLRSMLLPEGKCRPGL
jgi:hypothetical protein